MSYYRLTQKNPNSLALELYIVITIFLLCVLIFWIAPWQQSQSNRQLLALESATSLHQEAVSPLYISMQSSPIALISASVSNESLGNALTDLLKGPNASQIKKGQFSEIPRGTHLLSMSIHHKIVTLNLSKEFTLGGGSTSMIQRVAELKKTLACFDKNYILKVLIDGKPLPYLGGEGLEI